MTQFDEVRCNYFDDAMNCWCVDAWFPNNDEGTVVAFINPDTYEVTYNDEQYKRDTLVLEVIVDKLKEILKYK